MTAFSQGFNSFIDNYILLLAARFNAPLDAASLSEGDHDDPWEKVSRCVRDVLFHPLTEAEKREVAHVDVSLFDAQACRGRALYFQWRLQEDAAAAATARKADAAPGAPLQSTKEMNGGGSVHAVAPAPFDITKDSLRDEVERIYTTVRMNLPSTFALPSSADGAASNHGEDGGSGEGDAGEGEEEVLDAVDFPLRTEDEVQRDLAIAEARDALLTKVQQMQAEFYAQHRRWVDVPLDMDLAPLPKNAVERSTLEPPTGANAAERQPLSKSAMREALMSENTRASPEDKMPTPAKMGNAAEVPVGSGADSPTHLFEALKRSVHVNRPPRPSQMREEDYRADYKYFVDAILPSKDASTETRFDVYQRVSSASDSRMPQGNSRPNDSATRNRVVPASRASRWKVLEYEGEADEDSDDTN
ncbi:uncharacterized protein Tco025E_07795 [Trypanosoma conorhini]|uniref:Uncharacterized protein n=1 Tax=Trypanosoma conorhini TaxID=83891 RepID=A0A422NIN9_9TRYP|nr:uncharacterized protein Tco025E_07795 [Trypanosoma conorhini]RNF05319.1 hypothetical protein Tco025E_07795 [Trypanosoma conorhini]